METDAHLTKLLADLPGSLARDEVFVSELNNITKVVAVDKGDYLLRTGEICQDAYFINKGLFINLYVSEKGDECVTGFSSDYLYPFLSAIGYFTQAPSEFEIKALESGELLRLSRAHIEDLSLYRSCIPCLLSASPVPPKNLSNIFTITTCGSCSVFPTNILPNIWESAMRGIAS